MLELWGDFIVGDALGPLKKAPVFVGVYLVVLGGVRFVELAPIARGYVVDGFPEWILPFLTGFTATLLLAGVALVAGGIGLWRNASWSRHLLLGGAFVFVAGIVSYSWFLISYEQAFADGGAIWGFVHLLTLTRLPTTGTEAGVFGYKIGLGMGIACWLALALLCLRIAVMARRVQDAAPTPTAARPTP